MKNLILSTFGVFFIFNPLSQASDDGWDDFDYELNSFYTDILEADCGFDLEHCPDFWISNDGLGYVFHGSTYVTPRQEFTARKEEAIAKAEEEKKATAIKAREERKELLEKNLSKSLRSQFLNELVKQKILPKPNDAEDEVNLRSSFVDIEIVNSSIYQDTFTIFLYHKVDNFNCEFSVHVPFKPSEKAISPVHFDTSYLDCIKDDKTYLEMSSSDGIFFSIVNIDNSERISLNPYDREIIYEILAEAGVYQFDEDGFFLPKEK